MAVQSIWHKLGGFKSVKVAKLDTIGPKKSGIPWELISVGCLSGTTSVIVENNGSI